jgi:hypothetical protein
MDEAEDSTDEAEDTTDEAEVTTAKGLVIFRRAMRPGNIVSLTLASGEHITELITGVDDPPRSGLWFAPRKV